MHDNTRSGEKPCPARKVAKLGIVSECRALRYLTEQLKNSRSFICNTSSSPVIYSFVTCSGTKEWIDSEEVCTFYPS